MRWGKPIKRKKTRDPRYFLNENEFSTSLEEEADLPTEADLRKLIISAEKMGRTEQAEKYRKALKVLAKDREKV